MSNPFEDRSTPIILRARDMRPEAYAEQHIAAIDLLIGVGVGDEIERKKLSAVRDALRSDLATYEAIAARDSDIAEWDSANEELSWSIEDAVRGIEANTPEGWDYTSEESDPSYGGFYPYENEED